MMDGRRLRIGDSDATGRTRSVVIVALAVLYPVFTGVLDLFVWPGTNAIAVLLSSFVFGGTLLALTLSSRSRRMPWACALAWCVSICFVVTTWNPRKRFVRTVLAVPIGATIDDATLRMAEYELCLDLPPNPAWLLYTWRPNEPGLAWNNDSGWLRLKDGHVVEVEFSPHN